MNEIVTITRKELYEQVWSTPMTRLAAKFGLSGRGLAKLCEREKIPVPGRGYWRRKECRYTVKKDPLPVIARENPISIHPTEKPPEHHDPRLDAQIAFESGHPIVVPDRLNRPHQLVARLRDHLASQKPDGDGLVFSGKDCPHLRVSRALAPRALRIWDALLKALDERGISALPCDGYHGKTRLRVFGEEIEVGLEEHLKRSDHVLTPKEEAERKKGGYAWSPRYDFTPDGILTFTIHTYAPGARKRWADGKKRPLESYLNEIIVTLVAIAVTYLIPRRLESEQRRRREEQQRRAWEREQARREALRKNQESWVTTRSLRSFIAAVEREAGGRPDGISEGSSVERWLLWARQYADGLDPMEDFVTQIQDGKWTIVPPDGEK
jgi:hypothetical protein